LSAAGDETKLGSFVIVRASCAVSPHRKSMISGYFVQGQRSDWSPRLRIFTSDARVPDRAIGVAHHSSRLIAYCHQSPRVRRTARPPALRPEADVTDVVLLLIKGGRAAPRHRVFLSHSARRTRAQAQSSAPGLDGLSEDSKLGGRTDGPASGSTPSIGGSTRRIISFQDINNPRIVWLYGRSGMLSRQPSQY